MGVDATGCDAIGANATGVDAIDANASDGNGTAMDTIDAEAANTYTFGIEEELFLVDRRTRLPPSRVPKRFVEACRSRLGDRVTYELQQAQVEIVSPIFSDPAQALLEMGGLRRAVAEIASPFGFGILSASTHPLAMWQRQRHTEMPRYQQFIDTYQMVGRRDIVCGMHVHVAVPKGVDRVGVMNRLMPWVPLFLALSTSSPFWNRRRTGLLSYRQAMLAEWPRSGVPDFFSDEGDYAAFVAKLVRAGAARDGSELWWAIRPSPNFPTLELRVADACTSVQDSIALAMLYRCLVRTHVRRPELGATRTNATRRLIEENIWRAQRYGLQAEFIDETRDACVAVPQLLDEAMALVLPDAQALGAADVLETLRTILVRGTSAQQQMAHYDASRATGAGHLQALRATTDWLMETTLAGCAHSEPEAN
jgi:carboxylate-amine ligase